MPHVRSFAPGRGVCCLLSCSDQDTGHARFPRLICGLGSVTVPQVGKLELSLRCVTRETGMLNGMTSAGFCYLLWPRPCKSPRGRHRAVSSRAGGSEGPFCSQTSARDNQLPTLGVSWSLTFYDPGSRAGCC